MNLKNRKNMFWIVIAIIFLVGIIIVIHNHNSSSSMSSSREKSENKVRSNPQITGTYSFDEKKGVFTTPVAKYEFIGIKTDSSKNDADQPDGRLAYYNVKMRVTNLTDHTLNDEDSLKYCAYISLGNEPNKKSAKGNYEDEDLEQYLPYCDGLKPHKSKTYTLTFDNDGDEQYFQKYVYLQFQAYDYNTGKLGKVYGYKKISPNYTQSYIKAAKEAEKEDEENDPDNL